MREREEEEVTRGLQKVVPVPQVVWADQRQQLSYRHISGGKQNTQDPILIQSAQRRPHSCSLRHNVGETEHIFGKHLHWCMVICSAKLHCNVVVKL